ncbi:transcription factor IIIB 50 kDa subunit [Clarias magur]|uniref:Transcription factor IIIB 50 kDa subunit n=1 Tax=Clarias magur TaxID=1594786 RepID=A0A8J4T9A4_CLAMG|nr:transcription factor IIIB 50 kDa subunit [Clarias magur]
MPPPCSECGSNSVVEDELYSQTQWVCQDCGSVIAEGTFTTTLSEEQYSTAVPYYITTEVTKKPCPNLLKGLGRVRSLCRILRLSRDMESEVTSLYERAYQHPVFLKGHLMKKEMLGGSCVLSVCRQNNWPVAIGTISMLLDADPASMGTVYNELNKALNIQNKTPCSFTELLESHCHEYKLGPSDVPDFCVESVGRLVQRSTALLELASDVWLVTGRQPLPLITACVYVAWQSLKPMVRF